MRRSFVISSYKKHLCVYCTHLHSSHEQGEPTQRRGAVGDGELSSPQLSYTSEHLLVCSIWYTCRLARSRNLRIKEEDLKSPFSHLFFPKKRKNQPAVNSFHKFHNDQGRRGPNAWAASDERPPDYIRKNQVRPESQIQFSSRSLSRSVRRAQNLGRSGLRASCREAAQKQEGIYLCATAIAC